MKLELLVHNDIRLRERCSYVNYKNPELDLLDTTHSMFQLMIEKGGIGLAAPQVGIFQRFFVLKVNDAPFVCINPEIIKFSKITKVATEGCLSFPDSYLNIERPFAIRAKFRTLEGEAKMIVLKDLFARAFQHEYDHLEGILFTDKL